MPQHSQTLESWVPGYNESRAAARCRASRVRTNWGALPSRLRAAPDSGHPRCPRPHDPLGLDACRKSFSSRTRGACSPVDVRRNRVRALVLPRVVGCRGHGFGIVGQGCRFCASSDKISYELGSCAENLSRWPLVGGEALFDTRCARVGMQVKVMPLPRVALHFEVAPWRASTCLTIAQPQARAGRCARSAGVDAKKRSVRRECARAEMPMPGDLTAN